MSIQAQTVMPDEVIVVDNNSTDATAAVAAQFPFVRILHEPKQGVVHARNTGFNAARGSILGRIDADTLLAPNWVETVLSTFRATDAAAITGSVCYHAVPFARFFSGVDKAFRGYLAWSLGGEVALQGANLAIRRDVWRTVRSHLCNKGGMHEDFDLAIHVYAAGYVNLYIPQMVASITFRQAASRSGAFARYVLLSPGTYAQHGRWRRVVMYPVVAIGLIAHPILHMLYMGYDEQADRFSFGNIWRSERRMRVNPALFVE